MADQYHRYSAAWVNQFDIKDMGIEFVTNNVSSQGNKLKIKLNWKVEEICRYSSSNYLWNE